jgi:hypothetical protein
MALRDISTNLLLPASGGSDIGQASLREDLSPGRFRDVYTTRVNYGSSPGIGTTRRDLEQSVENHNIVGPATLTDLLIPNGFLGVDDAASYRIMVSGRRTDASNASYTVELFGSIRNIAGTYGFEGNAVRDENGDFAGAITARVVISGGSNLNLSYALTGAQSWTFVSAVEILYNMA